VPVDGGALPTLQPGASQVLDNGVPVNVEVFVDNSTDLVLKGDGFELRLAGDCTDGCTIETTADGRQVLTLEERGRANVSGEGFQAGSSVYVWLFSEPRFLGELTVAADGTFTGTVPLGDIAAGEHTLQVNGTSFDGSPRTANLGVLVNPAAASLPATGADLLAVWVLAAALMGLGLLLARGRRRIDVI
jgi:LPXTG-motif cell wall-anchored protein